MVIGAFLMFAILAWLVQYKRKNPNISVADEAKELYAKAGITFKEREPFVIEAKLAELDSVST